jgi:demethylmenaquinone methyltransferase/2-methoxy-6-polyprenyl-1,4-benzoquinol methylase
MRKDRESEAGFAPVREASGSAASGSAASAPASRDAAQHLRELDLEALLADPNTKQSFVTPMFDVIAPRYDDFTRLFSFGMDARWKATLLREAQRRLAAGAGNEPRVLDLACGTGDLAFGVARDARTTFPAVAVLGVDASPEMTKHAWARLEGPDRDVCDLVRIETGDMSALSAADQSIDLITAGYAVRNAPSPELAIREAARVLRSGGVYITLDFYRPAFAPWRVALLSYLSAAGNLVGWTWHRSPVVYGYIARSIEHFMSWQDFSRALDRNGFDVQSVTRWLGGGVAMHVAVRR